MKKIRSMDEFTAAKTAFLEAQGEKIIMASELERRNQLVELAPLAKFAKLPAERLLQALAKFYIEVLRP